MPRLDAQHPVVQPDPFLLPPAAIVRFRRRDRDRGPAAADSSADGRAVPSLARDPHHDPFVVAAVDVEKRGGGLPRRRRIDRPAAALPRAQPARARSRDRLLGAAFPPAGVARVLRGDAAPRRPSPADGGAGRPRRAPRAPVPAVVDRLDVGHGLPALVLYQEHGTLLAAALTRAA